MSTTITRKEIATAADVSEDTVARRERAWGLDKCRAKGRKRPVSFFRDLANAALIAEGVIEKPI